MTTHRTISALIGCLVVALTAHATHAVSQYEFQVLKDNPLYYWNFDEAGGDAQDQINGGGLNALAPQGGATRVAHAGVGSGLNLGNAADFSGANGNRFHNPNVDGGNLVFVPTQLWVAEMWVQVQGPNAASRGDYLLESSAAGLNDPGLIYDFNHGGGDTNQLEMFSGGRTGPAGPAVRDNDFHHVVMAFYGNSGGFGVANRREIYLDGVPFVDTTSAFSAGFGLQEMAVGNTVAGGGQNGFEGRIDELAIYDIGSMLANPIAFGDPNTLAEFQGIVQQIAGHHTLGPAGESELSILSPVGYTYDPAGIQPVAAGARSDTALTKLTDSVIGRSNGGGAPGAAFDSGQYVGFSEAPFGTDLGAPHPGVTFDLGDTFNLAEIWIDYMGAGGNAGIEAPDSVEVRLSDDGVLFGNPLLFTGFNDQDTAGNDFFSRRLVLDLDLQGAQFVNLSFFNDNQWTFLSEVTFIAGVPEPASAGLLIMAGAALLRCRRGR